MARNRGISLTIITVAILYAYFGRHLIPPASFDDRLHPIEHLKTDIDKDVFDTPMYSHWWDSKEGSWPEVLHKMNPVRADYFDSVLQSVNKKAKSEFSVLELGCGGGILTLELAKRGYKIQGLDSSQNSLKSAREQASKLGLKDVRFRSGTIYDIPAVDDLFDAVVITEVTEHLLDLPQAYHEISRILKPGGVILFATINRTYKSWILAEKVMELMYGYPHKAHDWRLFIRPDEIESLLASHRMGVKELVGIAPDWSFPNIDALMQGHFLFNVSGFHKTEDLSVAYMGWAQR